ncbi:MAG: RNA polymerase sigma-70 factor [Prevotella sp.]|jgi:RNA polymerase sigma-70 factor (ECF subfamily)|nr:RNA polymerase sigma-70 factor [Prevotella sp.]MCH4018911.1 RNA polymerase sigma-70 factor [Prevotella sp.]MCH4099480.1 RNA polymerase sigma-70 factor [Prevotella sp.]MCI1325016.1 RNA polymerase sigma-70 factor [Prevotella sp.]MCI1350104.1 RNA polymerase sigma-70 factor [Prevotella sp.]MCI1415188.1 RNA polymerase sigma-70 factor [Prevotella sp.]
MDKTESTIWYRIKQGDEKAFEQLYHKYYETLCHFAAQLLHNSKIAEEVVDDVFFHIWDTRDTLEILSLRAYLVRSVRNNSLKAIRSNAFQNTVKAVSLSSEGLQFNEYLSDEGHPVGWIIEKDMEKQLMDAVNALPEECQRVFRMSRFEGKKYADIAISLGISVNTVKYHIKNAIKQLSKVVTPYIFLLVFLSMHSEK